MLKRDKMNDDRGFTGLELILAVAFTAVLVGGGVYIYATKTQSVGTTASTEQSNTKEATVEVTSKSDKELIEKAALNDAEDPSGAKFKVEVTRVEGVLAQGGLTLKGGGGGYSFYAKKLNGNWEIIFKGQETPSREIGEKYDLPKDWYTTEY